jgi:thiol:disulfide interchange protein
MKKRNHSFLTAFALAALFFFFSINAVFSFCTDSWCTTAAEYELVSEIAKQKRKPFILFFHVDWCGYCKQFKSNLLADAKVEGFLSHYFRVKINPENGDKENVIAMQYGVRGYPDFRVVFPDGSSEWVHPFKENGKIYTPDEFIDELKAALAKKN